MAIGANSYGSVDEIRAMTRRLLGGSAQFGTETRPTLDDVETIIDRVSGVLNSAIANAGFDVPISQATAKLSCDEWVVSRVVSWVEFSQPGASWSDERNERWRMSAGYRSAAEFVAKNARGWASLGVTRSTAGHEGFNYTGMDKHSERSDPDNTSREQPAFRRRQFDR